MVILPTFSKTIVLELASDPHLLIGVVAYAVALAAVMLRSCRNNRTGPNHPALWNKQKVSKSVVRTRVMHPRMTTNGTFGMQLFNIATDAAASPPRPLPNP